MTNVNWLLKRWFIDRGAKLGIEHSQFTLAPWMPEYTCRGLHLRHLWDCHGFGTAKDSEIGDSIAFSELVERVIARAIGGSTSGMAVHVDIEVAKQNALKELLERDALMWAWHFGAGTLPATARHVFGSKAGESWVFRRLPCLVDNLFVGVAALWTSSQGWIVASACDDSLEEALLKASREVSMVRAHQELHPPQPLSLESFFSKSLHTPEDHLRLCLDPEYAVHVSRWLKDDLRTTREPLRVSPTYEELTVPEWFSEVNLRAIRVTAPGLLRVYFGKPVYPGSLPHPLG
jgi:hypothetical protein